ncbi:MAG: polyprenyl synthetase family protein [Spirochaetales bacterium]|nr:polyprenyl synthetase family protein [Spirochaetales bacterium]
MNWLKQLFPEVRKILKESIPDFWPELHEIMKNLLEAPIPAEAVLPLAACKAVNGNPPDALHITAAILALSRCLRIFDDIADQDRSDQLWQTAGMKKAMNYAFSINAISSHILATSPIPDYKLREIYELFSSSLLILTKGQDMDIKGETHTIETYWRTIEMKSATAFALACTAGAIAGTDNPVWIKACREFGHHLGLAIQILNDMESIWSSSDKKNDLQCNRITLPVIYGLSRDHPAKAELESIVNQGNIADHSKRITVILDNINTRQFLVWSALEERKHALEVLAPCPGSGGKKALESYITGMFGDIDVLLGEKAL